MDGCPEKRAVLLSPALWDRDWSRTSIMIELIYTSMARSQFPKKADRLLRKSILSNDSTEITVPVSSHSENL